VTEFTTDTTKQGKMAERSVFRPYGEALFTDFNPAAANESKGFIGERYDADAGLQYLNARYYDPKLGMFIQPDWWEVTKAGVGTNRYSCSFNDPVNGKDPSGHFLDVKQMVSNFSNWWKAATTTATGIAANTNSAPVAGSTGMLRAIPMVYGIVKGLGIGPTGYLGDTVASTVKGAILTPAMVQNGFYIDGKGIVRDSAGIPIGSNGGSILTSIAQTKNPMNRTYAELDISGKLPKGWIGDQNRDKGGLRWWSPTGNPSANRVRVDFGDPGSQFSSQQVDHVVVTSNGSTIGRDGRPLKTSNRQDPNNAHIPLSEYMNCSTWNAP
jgi:RHS repeat-associated protein